MLFLRGVCVGGGGMGGVCVNKCVKVLGGCLGEGYRQKGYCVQINY